MVNGNGKHVAVIDPSQVILEGMKSILNNIPGIETISLGTDPESFIHKNNEKNKYIECLIINPIFLYNQNKNLFIKQFSFLKDIQFIALVYSYVNKDFLSQFDDVIYIEDSKYEIQNKLKSKSPNKEENTSGLPEQIDLSDREKEILISLTKGKTNKEIADEHCISIHTVISHRKNISRKTGIRSVSGLTVYALLNKLTDYSGLE